MANKARLLVTFGLILLVIGISFLAGTIYRSTNTSGFSYGVMFGLSANSWASSKDHSSVMTYALPPRNLSIDLKTNTTVDVYLLNDEGRKLWLSEGALKPVWSAKNVSTQAFTLQLINRENYGLLVYNPNNSTVTFDLEAKVYGYESDLLYFSLTAISVGLVITVASRIAFQERKKALVVVPRKSNSGLLSKDVQTMTKQPTVGSNELKPKKQFWALFAWELEEYMAFPILEILIFIAVCTVLSSTIIETSPASSYNNLLSGIKTVFMFLIFITGAMFCHSYAGSISRGETKMLLSYPVRRGNLFLSKFTALFTVIFLTYAGVFALQIYLLALNPFEPLFYVSIAFIALQLLLVCALTTALSLITKNEMISILLATLLLFGFENITASTSVISFTGRFTTGFAFISQQIHGVLPTGTGLTSEPTIVDAGIAIFATAGISVLLLILSYIYYTRKLEID